jgi:alpha-D-xyloside xylohydrolase
MPASRTIRVRWISEGKPVTDADAYDAQATYTGRALTIARK